MMRRLAMFFVRLTRPLVRSIASAYDIRLNHWGEPLGQHPVVFEDPEQVWRGHVPKSVYFNTASGAIRVGAGTVFGENVQLLTGKHLNAEEAAREAKPLHAVPSEGRDIVIGRNCYIGGSAIIIGPAVIGDHSVIAAGSIVVGGVPPRSFVAGARASVIRQLP